MREWFKKMLLKKCDWVGIYGFTWGLAVSFLGAILLGIFKNELGFLIVFLGICLGLFLAILFSLIRNKYIAYKDDYKRNDLSRSYGRILLLKVSVERVFECGDRIWGKDGIFPVILPLVKDGEFSVATSIVRDLGDEKVIIGISITAFVDERNYESSFGNYNPQELYDLVIKGGYDSVKGWLADSFTKAVGQAPVVLSAIDENYLNPPALIAAVKTAMKSVTFHPGLSNLKKVEVTIIDNSWSYRTKVVYT